MRFVSGNVVIHWHLLALPPIPLLAPIFAAANPGSPGPAPSSNTFMLDHGCWKTTAPGAGWSPGKDFEGKKSKWSNLMARKMPLENNETNDVLVTATWNVWWESQKAVFSQWNRSEKTSCKTPYTKSYDVVGLLSPGDLIELRKTWQKNRHKLHASENCSGFKNWRHLGHCPVLNG